MGIQPDIPQRRTHQTLGVQRLAVHAEDWWDFKPGQAVQTTDGLPGTVKAVLDGPFPGSEEYQVELDRGMGGGAYTASQLSPASVATAALEQTAAADYPELAQILTERPDPAGVQVYAAKGNPFADKDDSDDEEPEDDGGDDDKDDSDSDDDDEEEDDSDDKDDDSPPWVKKDAASVFASLIVTAAADADFRFQVTSAWKDVVTKAKRIRAEGGVRVTLASDGLVFAEVKGDTEVYEAGLQRLPNKQAVHSWSCGCKWGAYHWGADDDFSKFSGRMCSHALALQYEAQSRGMFGRNVGIDETRPHWVPRKVVVRYDIDADQHRLAPSTAARREAAVNPHGIYLRFGDWSHDERSNNNLTGGKEDGVSVYDLDHRGNPMDPDPENETDHWPKEDMHGRIGKAQADRKWGDDRPHQRAHLVTGDHVGFGADNEPLLQNVERVGDWMDHRHHFIPEANPHPLARSEDHEDYEPPEVPPRHTHVAILASPPLDIAAHSTVAAGETREEVELALGAIGVTASVDSPFGEPSGTAYQLPKAPGATSPKFPWENPASAGPLAAADPVGWNRRLPLESFAALDDQHSIFEPGGTEAELNEEPEGALPSTDGVQLPSDDEALSPSIVAGAGLQRHALKDFTLAQREELINEGEGVRAANLDLLKIEGTHYADLESILAAQEDDTTWLS
ncbi:hypothetical protein QFZ75_007880 [Streptomyces sp. V3I8]|uniref:hypothetical protein n=1 Tax=Streptomyces sp. V3I8 TaxID=3042279 RepID=UPI0027811816|nr:hypothetical protein [Streptomyces sp. V3I8]MDQ1041378.1 hypothetical protein [Streptomyces sp. V3I8]